MWKEARRCGRKLEDVKKANDPRNRKSSTGPMYPTTSSALRSI